MPFVSSYSISTQAVPEEYESIDTVGSVFPEKDWKVIQDSDADLQRLKQYVERGVKPRIGPEGTKELKLMVRQFRKVHLREGILYRVTRDTQRDDSIWQLVVPNVERAGDNDVNA